MVRSLAYREKQQEELKLQNSLYHLQGQYFASAISATVGNMFKKKGHKPYQYPEKPFELAGKEQDLTEDEIQKQRELFVAKLMVMKSNFELNHKDSAVS